MTTTTIIHPGETARPAGEIPFLRIPERNAVFHDRAVRLRTLAQGHAMQDFLLFMASVCDVQQTALNAFPTVPLPPESQINLCREHCMPPLSAQSWRRAPEWQDALRHIVAGVKAYATPAAEETIARLQKTDSALLEVHADAMVSGRYNEIDLAAAPFIAAALQVYWTHMTTSLGTRAFCRSDIANLCPVCASAPVASIVRIGAAEQGLRYLACSLCQTQWHMVRVKCSNCETTKGINYYAIEGATGAVKAEFCDGCGSYLKIAYMDKDPHVDPIADDLATLVLDLVMGESGMSRSGPNLFLVAASDQAA